MKVRRSPFAFLYLEDSDDRGLSHLLGGVPTVASGTTALIGLSILTAERHRLAQADFEVLAAIPSESWIDAGGLNAVALRRLIAHGLVVCDADDDRARHMRERDEALSRNEWNLYGALYHYMTQWTGFDIRAQPQDDLRFVEETRAEAREFVARHGPAPSEFAQAREGPVTTLPRIDRDGAFYDAVTQRRTTRAFDLSEPMALEDLDAILHYVFGCHGYATLTGGTVCVKRTSPSGGGLHPVEVYPVITNVDGIEPGIYQYRGHNHSLVRIRELTAEDGRRTAATFMCGQQYFGDAHVSFILTARFYRNHWKYRRHQKAYAAILMDAAHLSQTLYLLATHLGLGAYVTIAINSRDIEQCLELDGAQEGVIAMMGCGPRSPDGSPLELHVAEEGDAGPHTNALMR